MLDSGTETSPTGKTEANTCMKTGSNLQLVSLKPEPSMCLSDDSSQNLVPRCGTRFGEVSQGFSRSLTKNICF